MADFWFYLFVGIGSVIIGGMAAFIAFYIIDTIKSMRIKKNIPDDYGKEGLANAGPPSTDKKEVEEDERRSNEKFREFEKLRRVAAESKANGRTATNGGEHDTREELATRLAQSQGRSDLQTYQDSESTGINSDSTRTNPRRKKRSKILKPTDF